MHQSYHSSQLTFQPKVSPHLLTVTSIALVTEVIYQMHQHQASCVLVTEDQRLVGIFTERDVVRAIAATLDLSTTKISTLMTRQVLTLDELEAADAALVSQRFRRDRVHHLPIVNSHGQIIAIATPQSVSATLKSADWLHLRRVSEVMETRIVWASAQASVHEVARLMMAHQVSYVAIIETPHGQKMGQTEPESEIETDSPSPFGCLPQSSPPIGFLTEHDLVQLQGSGKEFTQTSAGSVVNLPRLPIRCHQTLESAYTEVQYPQQPLTIVGFTGDWVGVMTHTSFLKALDPIAMSELIQSLQKIVDQKTLELRREGVQRRQLAESLSVSEQRWQTSQSALDDTLNRVVASITSIRFFEDCTWVYDYRSAGCERIFGYTAKELMAESRLWVSRVLPEDLETVILPSRQDILASRTVMLEYRFRHKDGSLRWISANLTSRRDELTDCWIVTSVDMDITDRKHTEAALHTLNTRLEQQVQERTAELLRANQELANEVLQHQLQIQRSKALNRVIQTIRNSLDLETVFATATAEFVQLLQADCVGIMQYLPDQQIWQNVSDYHTDVSLPSFLGATIPDRANAIADRLKQLETIRIGYDQPEAALLRRELADKAAGSWLIVPLQVDCDLWGSLNLLRDASLPWQESDVELVGNLVDQLAIAIHQAELHRQVQQLNVNLERQVQTRTTQLQLAYDFESTLKQITDKVRDSLDEDQILESAVKALAERLGVGCCNAAIFDIEHGTSTIRYEYAAAIPPSRGKVSQLADFPEIYEQLLQGHHFQFCSLLAHPERGNVSMFACPISDDKGVLGDLWLVNQSFYEFNDQDIRLVQQVANQCAIAIRQARLFQAAQAQVKELEQLNRLKDDFLSTVSHELRTPMANIKMAIQMLDIILRDLGMFKTQANPLDRYFRVLKDECQREITLIDDLLDLARLDSQTTSLNLSEASLQSWLPQIVEPFLARAHNQQQGLDLEISASLPRVKTDLSYLERALAELINNACKYTPAGGQISISASVDSQSDREAASDESTVCSSHPQTTITTLDRVLTQSDQFVVRVCNSGVEIPISEYDRIFDKFYRIPNGDPWRHGGTGLGLALVKKLVERLEGTIHVESFGGKTTFVMQLPIEVADLPLPHSN